MDNKSPRNCMTVGDLVRVLSGFPQDKLVHVDLADNDGNVWRGDVDGFPVVDEDGCWLQAGLVHHQTPEETLEMASDDVEDDVEEED